MRIAWFFRDSFSVACKHVIRDGFFRFFCLLFSFIILLSGANTYAIDSMLAENMSDSNYFEMFSQNNISFYDPTETDCDNVGSGACVVPSGDKMTWIGDSYSVGARSIIEEKFPGISFGGSVDDANSTIQGCKFVSASTSCNAKPTNPPALEVLQRVIDAGDLKPYLMFVVGTNGGWSASDVTVFKEKMSSHSDTKVVFVTSKTPSNNYSDSNAKLKELADSNDNYYLADYAAIAKDEYYTKDPDHIHPTANGGYEAWVNVIEEALPKNCADTTMLPGVTTAEKVWNWWINYFTEAGVKDVDIKAVTAGIMGNFMVESGINPFLNNENGWGIHMNLTSMGGLILKREVDKAVGNTKYWYFDGWWTDETTADKDFERLGIPQEAVSKAIDVELSLITNKNTPSDWKPYSGGWNEFMTGLRSWGVADTPRGYSDLFEVTVERAVEGNQSIEDPAVRRHYSGLYQGAADRRDRADYIYKKFANYSSVNPNVGQLNVTGVKINDADSSAANKEIGKNYKGDVVWTESQLATVEEFRPVYEAASAQYGIPWQAIASMHMLETGLSLKNPSNGQGLYQLYSYTGGGNNSRAFRPSGKVSMEEFKRQTMIAAEQMVKMMGGKDPSSDEAIKDLMFQYNGKSKKYKQKALNMGFTQAEAEIGEGSPYVMNRFDAKRDPTNPDMSPYWPGRYCGDGVWCATQTQSGFGGFVLYAALGGGGGASSGGVSVCSGDSTAAKMAGEGDLPIQPVNEPSVDVACDSRTIDVGVRDDAYIKGKNISIRLCMVPNIKRVSGVSGYGMEKREYAVVNSRVSGAFYAFAEAHKERYGVTLTAREDYRTYSYQAHLRSTLGAKQAAKAGYSNHQSGLAIDFVHDDFYGSQRNSLCVWGSTLTRSRACYLRPEFPAEFGLRDGRSFNENWHIEALGN